MAASKELVEEFIASKHPQGAQDDELEAVPDLPEQVQKASTIFSRNGDDVPVLWDYQIKGFFKDACGMLNRVPGQKVAAHKKIIDGLVFVTPRKIPITLTGDLCWLERPLRAQTAQGERIALARSEAAPIGSSIEFEIILLNEKLKKLVIKWLDYGALRGLGQWRNGSYGRFRWQEIK